MLLDYVDANEGSPVRLDDISFERQTCRQQTVTLTILT